jgi:nucleoside-diphosphate-sugar epimerase
MPHPHNSLLSNWRLIFMHVFVTGANGWVGSAVVNELIAAGHTVLGLAHTDAGVASIAAVGAQVHRGTLEEPESLVAAAKAADGVIHTAFSQDFSKFVENGNVERRAIAVLGDALAGSGRPLIVTSGTALLGPGLATEDTPVHAGSDRVPRDPETAALAAVPRGVRASIVHLPPTVHGNGDHGFVAVLIAIAREKGVSVYVGEGENHWPAVHRLDAAAVFRLAFENGAPGACYHAVAEQGIPFRRIAETIGRGLKVPVASISPDKVADHFGWFARFATIDNRASSEKTRAGLGWEPTCADLIDDLDEGHYFGN